MKTIPQPQTLADVTDYSESIEDFGLLLREWIHFIQRRDVSNRPELSKAIGKSPRLLATRFKQGEVADAYLGAYAEWIADKAKIKRPEWVRSPERVLQKPWFADEARASLLVLSPASFRQRNLFTIPESVIKLRRGRPRVSEQIKKEKARERNQRYRARVREWIKKGRN